MRLSPAPTGLEEKAASMQDVAIHWRTAAFSNSVGCAVSRNGRAVLPTRRRHHQSRRLICFDAHGRAMETSVAPAHSAPSPGRIPHPDAALIMGAAVFVQSIALVGAIVGGFLARKRRFDLEQLNLKLRQINYELRRKNDQAVHVCEADAEVEAVRSYKAALEMALDAPSAAHPVEAYGPEGYSLAEARRDFSRLLLDAKDEIGSGNGLAALEQLEPAVNLSQEIADLRAERSAVRTQAEAYRTLGDLHSSLSRLQRCLQLSLELEESTGDVDVLGEIADVYADLGDYEHAGEYYDKCIVAIQEEAPSSLSPYWDC